MVFASVQDAGQVPLIGVLAASDANLILVDEELQRREGRRCKVLRHVERLRVCLVHVVDLLVPRHLLEVERFQRSALVVDGLGAGDPQLFRPVVNRGHVIGPHSLLQTGCQPGCVFGSLACPARCSPS